MWDILEINETKNKLEIKEAYMMKLQKINPEENVKEFKILRNAYKEALRFAESEKNTYLNKAMELLNKKLYDAAIEILQKALKEEGVNSEEVYDVIAFCLMRKGEYREAIECFTKILDIASKYTDVYRKIGYMYYKLEDYDNAIKYYELQTKLTGTYPSEIATDKILIANCYEKLNDEENIVKYYKEALNTFLTAKMKTPYECTYIGKCYKALNRDSEAVNYFKKALNLELCESCHYKGCYDGCLGLGEIYEKQNEYEEALKYYKKALETNEDDKISKDAIKRIEVLLN